MPTDRGVPRSFRRPDLRSKLYLHDIYACGAHHCRIDRRWLASPASAGVWRAAKGGEAQGERTRSSANLSRRRAAKETLAARLVSGYTIGAFIHVLLVIAPVSLLVQFVSGRRVV